MSGIEDAQGFATHLPKLKPPSLTFTDRSIAVFVAVLGVAFFAFAAAMIASVSCPVATNTTDVFDGCLAVGYPLFRAPGRCPCLTYKCERKPLTKDTCLAAAVKEFGDKVTAKRTMQTGSWHWVPPGCSVQSGGDFAAHWNTAGGKNDGSYTGVHVSNFIRWTGSCILSQWDLYTKNPDDDEATKVAKRRKACIEKRMEKEAAAKKAAAEKAKTDAGGGDATNPDDTESDDTNTVSNLKKKKKKKKKTWASVLLPSDGGPDDPVCGDEAAEWGDKDPSKKGQVRVAAG